MGVSNNHSKLTSTHSYMDSLWLTTMGPGSLNADYCDNFYFDINDYVKTLKIYHKSQQGIVGMMYQLNNGNYKVYGDITGEDQSYTFTAQ